MGFMWKVLELFNRDVARIIEPQLLFISISIVWFDRYCLTLNDKLCQNDQLMVMILFFCYMKVLKLFSSS